MTTIKISEPGRMDNRVLRKIRFDGGNGWAGMRSNGWMGRIRSNGWLGRDVVEWIAGSGCGGMNGWVGMGWGEWLGRDAFEWMAGPGWAGMNGWIGMR